MLPLLPLALLLVAHVHADNYRASPRIWRRETGLRNSTISFSNSTTSSTTSSTTTSSTPSSTATIPIAFPSSNDTSVTKSFPIVSPTFPLNSTTSTTPDETCAGSVTYTGSVYPTVYLTVTEGFDVTISASDASVTESATLVTPLPACEATVVSPSGVLVPQKVSGAAPVATIAVATVSIVIESTISAPAETTTSVGSNTKGKPHPLYPSENSAAGAPTETEAGQILVTQVTSVSVVYSTLYASSEYSSAPYTSTVIITKKTPVPVVAPPTSNPPIFQNPAPTKSGDAPATTHQNVPVEGDSTKNSPASSAPSPKPNGGGGGPVITTAAPNQALAPAPAATINNVPISVGASSIVVGTQAIAIPTTGAATVRADGQLFTVKASEIIASGTTLAFAALEQAQQTSVAATRITAAPGVVITVQGTTAVVAGTTYRIGSGASSTVLTVSGQKIQLGASGVILASTTVPALVVTAAPKVVETVGSLTFSVGASNVVLDGTTYRIGSGAPIIRTTVDGQSLSIGPGGVGVGSKTTLKPTTVTAFPTGAGSAATASVAVQTGAAASPNVTRMPLAEAFGLLLIAIAGFII